MAWMSKPKDRTDPIDPIIALDVPTRFHALAMISRLGDLCRFYKIGSELFTSEGPDVVRAVRDTGADVFLDLKFHDIPNTARSACRSAARLGVRLLTVHASGGGTMLAAAREGAEEGSGDGRPPCGVLGVTVLTSLDAAALGSAWGRDDVDVGREVLRLAEHAALAGLHGIVCSGAEAPTVRAVYGDRLATLVPGIRPAGADRQDQTRVVTPEAARAAGARYVVVGRAVTGAADPVTAMRGIREALSLGLA